MTIPSLHESLSLVRARAAFPAFVLILAALSVRAELVPPSRIADWSAGLKTGVVGGIPTGRTLYKNAVLEGADNTGATDALPVLQRLLNECPPGMYVYLPAGTYRINGGLVTPPRKSNFTIRGDGMGKTILDVRSNNAFNFGSGSDYKWSEPPGDNSITAGLTQGGTVLTIANTTQFTVGQICRISFANQYDDAALRSGGAPVFNNNGDPAEVRRQMVRIVAKTATTLTIFPGIYHEPQPGLGARINHARIATEGAGIEDLTVNCENSTVLYGIMFNQCVNSWIKNVEVKRAHNYPFYFADSLNCEVRGSFANEGKGGGTNGAGILLNSSSACLFEDNIVLNCFPGVEVNQGSSGNVFAYNLLESSPTVTATLNVNHGPHNSHNLYEGNIVPAVQSDGYFGGASEDMFFRNWICGTNYRREIYTFLVSLNRFTRNYSLIGNILGENTRTKGVNPYSFGNPNMGNSSYEGTASPRQGDFWTDWKATAVLIARKSDTQGTFKLNTGTIRSGQFRAYLQWPGGGSEVVSPVTSDGTTATFTTLSGPSSVLPPEGTVMKFWGGIQGFQDRDLDVEASTLLKANYHAWEAAGLAVPENQSLAGEILPQSFVHKSKPAFFGELSWPPFDPFEPSSANYERIPAGYRYVKGVNPPGRIDDSDAPAIPQKLTANVGGASLIQLRWEAPIDNVGVSGYRVERAEGAGQYSLIATPIEPKFDDVGLVASTSYSYRVKAVDAAGNQSGYTEVVVAKTTAIEPSVPSRPSNLRLRSTR